MFGARTEAGEQAERRGVEPVSAGRGRTDRFHLQRRSEPEDARQIGTAAPGDGRTAREKTPTQTETLLTASE